MWLVPASPFDMPAIAVPLSKDRREDRQVGRFCSLLPHRGRVSTRSASAAVKTRLIDTSKVLSANGPWSYPS